eukprot:783091-Heterocapsa_arctica.AAC.1
MRSSCGMPRRLWSHPSTVASSTSSGGHGCASRFWEAGSRPALRPRAAIASGDAGVRHGAGERTGVGDRLSSRRPLFSLPAFFSLRAAAFLAFDWALAPLGWTTQSPSLLLPDYESSS